MSSKPRPLPAVEGRLAFGNASPELWPRKDRSCERQRQPPGLAVAGLMGTERVLVVNPVLTARKEMVELIRQFGYRVFEAAGALQAQRKLKIHADIQLLMMDFSGLDMDDLQLARWFRVMYPRMKVLVASTSVWDINYLLGASEQIVFLPKPFTTFELARVLRRTLN